MKRLLVLALFVGCGDAPAERPSGEPQLSRPEAAQPDWVQQGERTWLTWQQDPGSLWWAPFTDGALGEPMRLVQGEEWFVNWADFGGVAATADGGFLAHFRPMAGSGTYAYHVGILPLDAAGTPRAEPGLLHRDPSPTEHGFTAFSPTGALWLDGQATERGGAMQLRYAPLDAQGRTGDEEVVDDRVCDCCQTALVSFRGAGWAFWRDRSGAEIRDISFARRDGDGWTPPRPVRNDGWRIAGCPVNGPAAAADDAHLGVAWYTEGADETPVVRAAFLDGDRFGSSRILNEGVARGRVDLAVRPDGGWLAVWLEAGAATGDGDLLRWRTLTPEGSLGPVQTLDALPAGRSTGFPRLVVDAKGKVWVAWTRPDVGLRWRKLG